MVILHTKISPREIAHTQVVTMLHISMYNKQKPISFVRILKIKTIKLHYISENKHKSIKSKYTEKDIDMDDNNLLPPNQYTNIPLAPTSLKHVLTSMTPLNTLANISNQSILHLQKLYS